MKFADRLKFTATGTSAASIADGTAVAKCRNIATVISDGGPIGIGDTNVPFTSEDSTGAWEDSLFTVGGTAQSPTLTRTQVLASSAGGTTPATFNGAITVYNTVPGKILSRVAIDSDVTSTVSAGVMTIPLYQPGTAWMSPYNVNAPLKFTPGAAAVKGARAYLRVVADGTNAPDFSSWTEWGGSLGYNNTAGILNEIQFMYDGYDYWYSASQATNAVASASALTLSLSAASSYVGTAITATVGANSTLTGTQSESVTLTAPATGTWSVNPVTLDSTHQTATSTFTPSASGSGSITAAATGTPSLASASQAYAANAVTVPAAPTIGSATAGDTTGSISFTAPSSNGGSAITGYTATAYKASDNTVVTTASGASSPVNFTGLTDGVAIYFKVAATNSVGTGAQSAASNTVTPSAAPAEQLTINAISSPQTVGAAYTVSGTWANVQPAALDYALTDNGGTQGAWNNAITNLVINAGGTWSFQVTPTTSSTSRTMQVRDHTNTGVVTAQSNTYVVNSAASGTTLNMVARENATAASGVYTGTLTGQSYGSGSPSGGIMDQAFSAGVTSSWSFRVAALTAQGTGANELYAGVNTTDFASDLNSVQFGVAIRTGGYTPWQSNAAKTPTNTVAAAVGDYVKFDLTGTSLKVGVSKDGGATYPANQVIYTFTVPSAQLFAMIRMVNAGAVDTLSGTGLVAPVRTPIRLTGAGITEGGTAGAYTYTGNGTVAAFSSSQGGMSDKIMATTANASMTVPMTTLGTGKVFFGCQSAAAFGAPSGIYVGIADDSPYAAYVGGSSNGQTNTVTPATGDTMRFTRQIDGTIRVQVSKDNGVTYTSVKEFSGANATYNYLPLYLTGTTAIGPIVGTGVA